ncbi:MAG TPA: alcohol dehydrogenase catalytic domain-containing protein, partial [Gaiellales bacterium]|nr:alcohol dehydrogenase catalytic domain-containing protein [Gaiellales bacterium]
MRAVILHEHGGPEHLVTAELPDPEPRPGEVVVDLVASALNHRDVWQRTASGNHGAVLGSDGAGVVSQLGEGVSGVEVGQEVVINPS